MSLSAAISGSHSLACDLVAHLCEQADITVTPDEPDVALLADPTPDDWAEAHALGSPIVLVTSHTIDRDALVSAVTRGANSVVHPECDASQFHDAVAVTAAGGAYLDPRATAELLVAVRGAGTGNRQGQTLTTREQQILQSIERGDSVKQTARALGIAHKTVENLQGRLFAKLGVRNRAQAIRRAHALGLLAD